MFTSRILQRTKGKIVWHSAKGPRCWCNRLERSPGTTVPARLSRYSFVFLFVSLSFSITLEIFFIHLETSKLPVRVCKFWPLLGTWAGFFSASHLLWHGTSVYNGHFQWPITFTDVVQRLEVELSLPVLTTQDCRGGEHSTFRLREHYNRLRHYRGSLKQLVTDPLVNAR